MQKAHELFKFQAITSRTLEHVYVQLYSNRTRRDHQSIYGNQAADVSPSPFSDISTKDVSTVLVSASTVGAVQIRKRRR